MPSSRLTGGRLRQRMRRDDPGLASDWGWKFALWCATTNQRPSVRFEGYWVCEATRLARVQRLDNASEEICLTRRHRSCWHTIRTAWQLARTDGPSRWAVEAMILAGQSDAQIAVAEQLTDVVVDCYTHLFFDVRQRLRYHAYILSQVLDVDAPWTGRDVGRVWGWFAYIGGPVVLQALHTEFTGMGRTDYCDLATDFYRNDLVGHRYQWLYWSIQDRLLPRMLSPENQWKLLQLGTRLQMAQQLLAPSNLPIRPAVATNEAAELPSTPVGLRADRRIA